MLAHAKLNLFLEVTGKRPNGYHELHSLAVFLDLADEVNVETSELISCESGIENNIMLKAAHKLAEIYEVKQGVKITFSKNIPMGGGLGGGSADAAAALVLLRDFWNLPASDEKLYEIGLCLGADVPPCLYSILQNQNAVIFRGIGEILEVVPEVPEMHFVLVNPNLHMATSEVFRFFRYEGQVYKNFLPGEDIAKRRNDLETVSTKLLPEIGDVLKAISALPGCHLARMTGSGATCFGIFNNPDEAASAADIITGQHPHWWVKTAKLK